MPSWINPIAEVARDFCGDQNLFVMTIDDLLNMLQFWLQPVTKASEMYDLYGDGLISTSDLLLLLGQFI